MTSDQFTAHPAVVKMTRDEARILAHYAAGESAKEIAANIRMDLGVVGLTLDSLCGNNRNLAHNLAVEWQSRANAVAASKGMSATPVVRPELARQTPQVLVRDPAPPAEAPAVARIRADDLSTLLDTAQTSGNPRLERMAAKIRDLLADLQGQVAEHTRDAQLRQELSDLEGRLAAVKEQLRPKRTAAAAAPVVNAGSVDTGAVRVWAAENGWECSARGRIPAAVLEAYRAAKAAGTVEVQS